jgi:exopolysaccharide biosynthesis polyprenyl glycosylphosphotransferase
MDRRKLLLVFDAVIIYVSFLLGYYFRFYTGFFPERGIPSIIFYFNITLFAMAAYIMILASLGMYREKLFPNFVRELATIIEGSFWTGIVLTAGTFFYRGFLYSRLAVGFAMLFSFILLWLFHYAFVKRERTDKKNILVVGSGKQVDSLIKRLKLHSSGRIHPETVPAFDEQEVESRLEKGKRPPLIIASPKDYGENLKLVSFASRKKLQLYLIPGIYQFLHSGEIDDIDGLPFLATGRIPLERFPGVVLEKTLSTIAGWIFFFLFCLALPLFFLIIKIDSRGPLFFRQERIGLKGKVFRIFKFRTMRFPFTGEAPFTSPSDKRVTEAGRFLRRYNLDEMPQIFNVINGEMSIVGPRPISTQDKFFFEYDYFQFRLRVKPGLTGWAQVHGLRGGHIEPEERLQYDLYYIENWSIWLDLAIILLSPGALRNAF